jgi:hypothetical protein
MGTTLTGTTPQDTYDSLIKVTDNGPIGATAKYLSDGLGNDSKLALSTGNVGINITAPKNQLHVNGQLQVGFVDASNDAMVFSWNGASTYGAIQTFSSSALALNPLGNNVGIGTSSPAYKLSVAGGFIQSTDGTRSAVLGSDGTGVLIGTNTNHYFRFISNDIERMRITETGDVGVGTSVPSVKLDVNGNIRSSTGILFGSDTAAANALDDYEEGTWTPTTLSDPTGAFSGTTGEYTKIGNVVHFRIVVVISSNFADNFVGGLPFTVGGSSSISAFSGAFNVANENFPDIIATTIAGQSYIRFYTNNDTNSQAQPATTWGTLRIFGSYRV